MPPLLLVQGGHAAPPTPRHGLRAPSGGGAAALRGGHVCRLFHTADASSHAQPTESIGALRRRAVAPASPFFSLERNPPNETIAHFSHGLRRRLTRPRAGGTPPHFQNRISR